MNEIERYGISAGQVYVPADGSKGCLIVRNVHLYADVGDVVVYDELQDKHYRIDAFKLAKVRYQLSAQCTEGERLALVKSLRAGEAASQEQTRAADLIEALAAQVAAMQADARRGKHLVDNAEWRTLENEQGGTRTWLSVQVRGGADLSCKAFRALAVDEVIAKGLPAAKSAQPFEQVQE